MTLTQEKILGVFKRSKIGVNDVLKPQIIASAIRTWNRWSFSEAHGATNVLIDEGYISREDNRFVLLQKGYDHIYQSYTIEETEKLILEVFKVHNIRVGQVITRKSFISLQQSIDRFHFDNYNTALHNLGNEKLIEFVEWGYKLTQLGYDRIY